MTKDSQTTTCSAHRKITGKSEPHITCPDCFPSQQTTYFIPNEHDVALTTQTNPKNIFVQEPTTLHCLADAMGSIMEAQQKTENGYVSVFCDNALSEIRKAIACFGEST